MKLRVLLSLLPICICSVVVASAPLSVQTEYNTILTAFQKKEWQDVIIHTKVVLKEFPDSAFLSEIYYLAGIAYFQKDDCEISNFYFSQFLEKYSTPKYFEEALSYKFQIAEKFENGSRRHVFGWEKMPSWMSAREEAYELYDEIIKTLPRHDLTASALHNKAGMLTYDYKYKEAIESCQTLIRRFPKHTLAPKSYLLISEIYLKQSEDHYPDRDFLEQARLNMKKFRYDFPREDRIVQAESRLSEMQDRYAKDLWNSAEYFAKKKKPVSAALYYNSILNKYPESRYAKTSIEKLAIIGQTNKQVAMDFNTRMEIIHESL